MRVIVKTAVELADREGLEAVSMRRVAEQLEVGTMSLYSHVPGKSELIDLMTDAAYGELYEHVEQPSTQPGGYREGMRFVAQRYQELYERHPWLLDAPLTRPVLGPSACMKYEAEVRVLDGIGLSDPEIDSIVALLVLHVQSTARARIADLRAQQSSGLSEEEWWTTTIPLLLRVRTGSYPVAGRVGPAAGQALQASGGSPDHLFRFGLELLCDSVATLIERRRTGS
ncbi:MAG TPA: TetR/AcrR family transcriptional regulator [Polyangiaceae bacterium]|nr:TetR/AcrR family transcriptional regulator [Polyangiaceae bacterium]